MLPLFPAGKVIVATKRMGKLRPGDIVIVLHEGLEKIKLIQHIQQDRVFLIGLNPASSTDSRQFGWISRDKIIARVLARNSSSPFL